MIGTVVLATLTVTASRVLRAYGESHHRDDIPDRRFIDVIAEALVVRERAAGHIDAATYQARMSDLVSGARQWTVLAPKFPFAPRSD
jgi:hypothetical protein